MSLRHDIHNSMDEIAPSTRGLSERVIASVMAGPRRPRAWAVRLRAPLALVAALLLIALVGGVLVGGQILRDWTSHRATPAGTTLSPLAMLESRPLHLPAIASAAQCRSGPLNAAGDLGSGPFHASGSAVVIQTSWGSYYHDFLYVDHQVAGPVILRAADLLTKEPLVFIGDHAAGSTIGKDTVAGQIYPQHLEFVLPVVDAPLGWQFTVGRPKSSSGCLGWEVDSPALTEVWVLYDRPATG